LNHVLLFLCRARRFGLLKPILPVIHHLHYRRAGQRRYFDQIQPALHGNPKRFLQLHDAELRSVGTDESYRTDTNLPVDSYALLLFFILDGQ
jgi:hypothetical protein